MIQSKDVLLQKIKNYMGDDISDDAISIVEDISDTYDDLVSKTDIESRIRENDEMWRKRYMDRFMTPLPDNHDTTGAAVVKDNETDVKTELEDVTFDDLFEKREG